MILESPGVLYYEHEECLIPGMDIIGRWDTQRAVPGFMRPHHHGAAWEIHCILRGRVEWFTADDTYEVGPGNYHISRPYEIHGAADTCVHPSLMYWTNFAFPPAILTEGDASERGSGAFAGMTGSQTIELQLALEATTLRIFPFTTDLRETWQRLLDEHTTRAPFAQVSAQSAFLQILTAVLRDHDRHKARLGHTGVSPSLHVQRALTWMDARITDEYRIDDVAAAVGISTSYLHRLFVEDMGYSPGDYQAHLRVRHGKDLLTNSRLTVSRIAQECGFSTAQYFSVAFKRITGITPTQFREHAVPGK